MSATQAGAAADATSSSDASRWSVLRPSRQTVLVLLMAVANVAVAALIGRGLLDDPEQVERRPSVHLARPARCHLDGQVATRRHRHFLIESPGQVDPQVGLFPEVDHQLPDLAEDGTRRLLDSREPAVGRFLLPNLEKQPNQWLGDLVVELAGDMAPQLLDRREVDVCVPVRLHARMV